MSKDDLKKAEMEADDLFVEEDDDAYATVTMVEDDGTEVEFVVISSVIESGVTYLLVVEADLVDDDEADAVILKEVTGESESESCFAIVEDDDEFLKAVAFFQNSNDDYDIEINE